MIVNCPSCSTRFQVPDAALGTAGRSVRCSNCGHKWHQVPEGAPEPDFAAAVADAGEAAVPAGGRIEPTVSGGESAAAATLDAPTLDAAPAAPRQPRSRSGSRAGWLAFLLVVAVIAFGVWFGRDYLVTAWPPAQQLYDTLGLTEAPEPPGTGLAVRNVTPRRLTEDGVAVLEIAGEVYNESDVEKTVPELMATLCDGNDEVVQQWPVALPVTTLQPGESVPFRTRIEQPSEAATSIRIMFTDGVEVQ